MKKSILLLALLLPLLFTILSLFPFVTTIRANGTGTRAQPPIPDDVSDVSLVCSPDRPTILPGETVILEAWTNVSNPNSLKYIWNINAGNLIGSGAQVIWDSTGMMPDAYTATVKGTPPRGSEGSCSLKIVVLSPETKGLKTGSLLQSGNREEPGYGLYSYLLLPAQPPFAAAPKLLELYLDALKAYVSIADSVQCLERSGIPHSDLNITYMPVVRLPSEGQANPPWLLENYDFARARAILKLFDIDWEKNSGPFIISVLSPPAGDQFTGDYLFQDLSASYGQSQLTFGWVKAFMNRAAQVRRWDQKNTERVALQLKIVMRQLGIRSNLNECIRWTAISK